MKMARMLQMAGSGRGEEHGNQRPNAVNLEGGRERGHGAGQIVSDQEGHNAKHREAAVLQLGLALPRLLLGRERAGEVKRGPELDLGRPQTGDAVKWQRIDFARHAAPHVVRLLRLRRRLQHQDEEENLELALLGHVAPRIVHTVRIHRSERHALGDLARESVAGSTREVAHGRKHSNAGFSSEARNHMMASSETVLEMPSGSQISPPVSSPVPSSESTKAICATPERRAERGATAGALKAVVASTRDSTH